jgi:hypothetical protein
MKLKIVLEQGMDGYIVAYCPALKGILKNSGDSILGILGTVYLIMLIQIIFRPLFLWPRFFLTQNPISCVLYPVYTAFIPKWPTCSFMPPYNLLVPECLEFRIPKKVHYGDQP